MGLILLGGFLWWMWRCGVLPSLMRWAADLLDEVNDLLPTPNPAAADWWASAHPILSRALTASAGWLSKTSNRAIEKREARLKARASAASADHRESPTLPPPPPRPSTPPKPSARPAPPLWQPHVSPKPLTPKPETPKHSTGATPAPVRHSHLTSDWHRAGIPEVEARAYWAFLSPHLEARYSGASARIAPAIRMAQVWRETGRTPALLRPWINLGLGPSEALAWIEAGINCDEAGQWRDAGLIFRLPEVLGWKRAGLTPSDATSWKPIAPRDVIRWRSAGFGHREAKAWVSLGPDRAKPWMIRGFAPEDATLWEAAGVAPARAGLWQSEGVTVVDAIEICKAGIDTPSNAADLGLNYEDLPNVWKAWEPTTRRYRDVLQWYAAGVPEPARARQWIEARCSPEIVKDLADHGLDGDVSNAAWVWVFGDARRLAASVASQWIATGLSLEEARPWIVNGYLPAEAKGRIDRGHPPQVRRSSGGLDFGGLDPGWGKEFD